MPSLRDIRRRIRSIRNTAKITRAMQLVAASRLRRAQQRVLASRPYADALRALIAELAQQGDAAGAGALHPLLAPSASDRTGLLLITPDRGLAGALNTNTVRRGLEVIREYSRDGERDSVALATVGRRGQDFFTRRGYELLATFIGLVDRPSYDDVIPIARVIIDGYISGRFGRAVLVYPRFVSTLAQRPDAVQLLPIVAPEIPEGEKRQRLDYIYEPDPITILSALLPRYIEVQIYQALLETSASFFSAQMVAMQNATDNANDLVQSFSLTYNRVRQANITREVTEIAAAAEAMAASSR
ncbi:MAG: ATP synthase F1 subunit gamma [Chloroflexi bacterium]|nr:ATP synthase F1 subunit gamma [Chloroflexota bacterium]